MDSQEQAKENRRLIQQSRKEIAAEAERFGNNLLEARRHLGYTDPDGKEWGQRMLKLQIGLSALAIAAENPDYQVSDTPAQLREWLTHPFLDTPADDSLLRLYIEEFDLGAVTQSQHTTEQEKE